MLTMERMCRLLRVIVLSLALVACGSNDGAPSSEREESTTTRTTEPSSTERSSLACAALDCEARNRACEEGIGDTDAECTSCLAGYGAVGEECRPLPATPANLEASTDDPEAVTLSWSEVPGATSYRVYRDGDLLVVVASPGHVDAAADAPTRPGVADLSATGNAEEVALSWTAPESEAGTMHSYEVSALTELESERSGAVDGRRSAWALLDYRIEVEQEAPVFVSAVGWSDTEAPGPTLASPLGLAASQGTRFDLVELTVTLPQVLPGAVRTYTVTPRWGSSETPLEGDPAQTSAGRAVPPEVEVLVEWADGDSWVTIDFSDPLEPPYPPETTLGFEDPTAPADGSSRTYRAQVVGTGLEELSQTAEGWRRAPLDLGESCSGEGQCSSGTWCPTNTSERYCSPNPVVGGVAMPFQFVPSGEFMMGSPEGEVGRIASREEQVSVTLTRDYFVQRTPVTQGQWESVMLAWNDLPAGERTMSGWSGATPEFGTSPAYFGLPEDEVDRPNCDDASCPVERISWWDAVVYANALSLLEGLEPCYTLSGCGTDSDVGAVGGGCSGTSNFCTSGNGTFGCSGVSFAGKSCSGYRLLTEAEWERAARGGTVTATYNGNLAGTDCELSLHVLDPIAWYTCNSALGGPSGESRTHEVGVKTPNAWGLYDMLGNVWEWTGTWFASAQSGGEDPLGPETGSSRVLRGGSCYNGASFVRAARRSGDDPDARFNDSGFRLARSAP